MFGGGRFVKNNPGEPFVGSCSAQGDLIILRSGASYSKHAHFVLSRWPHAEWPGPPPKDFMMGCTRTELAAWGLTLTPHPAAVVLKCMPRSQALPANVCLRALPGKPNSSHTITVSTGGYSSSRKFS